MRYEIVLPASGSYGQIRDFLKRSVAEIPVLSVDQVTLKKEEKNERRRCRPRCASRSTW